MTYVNKEQLLLEIDSIPEFVFREVALNPAPGPQDQLSTEPVAWNRVHYASHRAITEAGNAVPLAFVSGRYQLMQFKDMFAPLVEQECQGRVRYHEGFAIMDMFPEGPEFVTSDGKRIGITAYNSVNKTSALIVRFSLLNGNRIITLPSNISGFYKAHVGKMAAQTTDYIALVNRIKTVWAQVIDEFSKIEVTEENFDVYTKDFATDPRVLKEIKIAISAGSKYNLWELVMETYDKMEVRYSKSEVHRRKRMDTFVQSITNWGTLLSF